MKKLLLPFCLILSTLAFGQNAVVFTTQTNCPIVITAPTDSAMIFGQASITGANDTVIGYLWKQISGPAAVLVSPTSSQTMVRKLVPGSYIFSMTATTKLGAVQTITNDQITVLPAPPPPRTVTTFTLKLVNGVWIPSFTYNDGSTQ